MLVANTFRLVGFTLGAVLYLFLAVLLARKRGKGRSQQVALAAASAGALWHVSGALGLFLRFAAGLQNDLWLRLEDQAAQAGMLAAPLAAVACLNAARSAQGAVRRFLAALAVSLLAATAAGVAAGTGSALLVFASQGPALCFAYFVYRHQLLGLLISRRLVFALTLGVVFAAYLFLVQRVALFVEDEFGAFGALIEVGLIFAAALVWLPLYRWINRFLSQRAQLYADFSKRLIEEAARILDLGRRVQFLAEEVGRSFGLGRVLLMTLGETTRVGWFGGGQAPEFERLRGLVGRVDRAVVHADQEPALSDLGFQYVFPLRYEDRRIGMLLIDASPRMFLDEDEPLLAGLSGQISHSIETCRVIEEKIRLERTLVTQEHLAGLGKVAATIAHEIKNPLSSIKTLVQLMGEDPEVESRYSRDLRYIVGEIERLNRSVQQLLNFSRPAPEADSEVDLTELLESAAGVLARQYQPERIRVESCVAPGLRLKRGNPEVLQQIILNLALNAIQASPPGGAVVVEAGEEADGSVRISVSDQGPGIPAEIREKIFEPFFTTKQKGTGLGLPVVRKNVRHLGGEIRVESPIESGRGTRVRVILPQ